MVKVFLIEMKELIVNFCVVLGGGNFIIILVIF